MSSYDIYRKIGNPVNDGSIKEAVSNGMIPKSDLEDMQEYFGYCRNADRCIWIAKLQRFVYTRSKFRSVFCETIPHPEDDGGFDIFVPVGKSEPFYKDNPVFIEWAKRELSEDNTDG